MYSHAMKKGMLMEGFARLSSKYYLRWYTDGTGLTKEALSFSYDLIKAAGFARTLLYDRDELPTNEEFVEFLIKGHLVFQLYRADGTPMILFWMEPLLFTGKQYFSHFTSFGLVSKEELLEGAGEVLHFLAVDSPIEQLFGLTPCCLRHAWKFAESIGYDKLARITSCIYCLGKERDATLSLCNLKEKWG